MVLLPSYTWILPHHFGGFVIIVSMCLNGHTWWFPFYTWCFVPLMEGCYIWCFICVVVAGSILSGDEIYAQGALGRCS